VRYKIGIVGAGNVGGTTAQRIAERNYADVVLLDIPAAEGLAQGKALDIQQSGPVMGYDTKLYGGCNHDALQDCEVVVVTAGSPRKPGMSRDDLVAINQGVMNEWGGAIKQYAPNSVVIVVTNPWMPWHRQCIKQRLSHESACWVWQESSTLPVSVPSSRTSLRFRWKMSPPLSWAGMATLWSRWRDIRPWRAFRYRTFCLSTASLN
jgi:hypothetical protein